MRSVFTLGFVPRRARAVKTIFIFSPPGGAATNWVLIDSLERLPGRNTRARISYLAEFRGIIAYLTALRLHPLHLKQLLLLASESTSSR